MLEEDGPLSGPATSDRKGPGLKDVHGVEVDIDDDFMSFLALLNDEELFEAPDNTADAFQTNPPETATNSGELHCQHVPQCVLRCLVPVNSLSWGGSCSN